MIDTEVPCPDCGKDTFINVHTPCGDHPELTTSCRECSVCDWRSDEWPTHVLEIIVNDDLSPMIDKTKEKLAHDIAVKHGFRSDDGGPIPLAQHRYQNGIADQTLEALNFLRVNELDNVTLHHDNPDFFGPNNIITVSGHWTGHMDRDFTGETLLESLEKAVKAKQRATV